MNTKTTNKCSINVDETLDLILAVRSKPSEKRKLTRGQFRENVLLVPARFRDDELNLLAHVYEQIEEGTLVFFSEIARTDRLPIACERHLLSDALAERVMFRMQDGIDEPFQAMVVAQGGFKKYSNLMAKVAKLECEESIGLFLTLEAMRKSPSSRLKGVLTGQPAH